MKASREFAENEFVRLTIPSTVCFILPFEGIRRDEPTLTIATDAKEGVVLPAPVLDTDPVGSFMGSTELAYSPARAGAETQITLRFRNKMRIRAGQIMRLTLPGFLGGSQLDLQVSSSPPFLLARA
eukprot:1765497-Rhodomonas_salina.1